MQMSEMHPAYAISPERRVIGAGNYRTDTAGTTVVQYHLDAICSTSRLRNLTLVIHSNWPFYCMTSEEYRGPNRPGPDHFDSVVTSSDVWDDLAALLDYRRDLKVTLVRLHYEGGSFYNEIQHKRIIKQLTHRLGIRDVRETALFKDMSKGPEDWT